MQICKICNAHFDDLKKFSNHLKSSHGITSAEYTIKFVYEGIQPLCKKCGTETRYVSFEFKEYCKDHAKLKMSSAGSIGGKASSWNKGLTASIDSRVSEAARKMTGDGNHFWGKTHSEETKKLISRTKLLGNEDLEERIALRENEFECLTSLEEYWSRQAQYLSFRCKTCNTTQDKTLQAYERGSLCVKCHPSGHSQWELEIYEWVKKLSHTAKSGDRKVISPKEIDIWVPDANLGIECHGLYFHSFDVDTEHKNSHEEKYRLAENAGISLLQVFWDEWRDRRSVVESMIKHRLGLSEKLAARKCKIEVVSSAQQRKFFEESHLAGYTPAKIAFGLYYDSVLVACLSIRKPRQAKWKDRLEVARFAMKAGIRVQGGLSKLAKTSLVYAKAKGLVGLMTYVDKRVGSGNGYVASKFVKFGETVPDYWYTDGHVRFDRFKFRAKDGKSETDVARESKVRKIYGAGSNIMTLS